MNRLAGTLLLFIAQAAPLFPVHGQAATQAPAATPALGWPPTLDTANTTTSSGDGRKIERFVHGGRPAWGYPANAAWPYPPLEKFESTVQNNNSFYLVSPKVPHDNAPLCVVLHSANRSGYDYMHYSSLTPGISRAITDSPPDFYALYLNSTNDEWWGWNQVQGSADFARHVNTPAPAERRLLDTIEWVVEQRHIDRNRIYLCGMSMGGSGTLGIGLANGNIFAAALVSCPAGTAYAAYRTNDFKFGSGEADPPVMVDFSSPPDNWSNTQPAYVQAAQDLHLPLVLGWAAFGHSGDKAVIGKYPPSLAVIAFPYLQLRKDEAYPVFTHASTDDHSVWLKQSAKPDDSGQLNAWFRWKNAADTPDRFSMQLWVASADEANRQLQQAGKPTEITGLLTPPVTATADLTFRRLQRFKVDPSKSYRWDITRRDQILNSGTAKPDASGILTLPQINLSTTPAELTIRPAG